MTEAGYPYRFLLEDKRWQSHLAEHGYVVIIQVLGPEAVDSAREKYWTSFEAVYPGVKREDPHTWNLFLKDPRGFLLDGRITHSEAAWGIRTNPAVKKVFAQIWETEDLLVSMDATIAWRPWWLQEQLTDNWLYPLTEWLPETEGLHIDQNPFSKPDFECVQGMVPLYSVNECTGGLEVVPGSHSPDSAVKKEIMTLCKHWSGDWCVLHPHIDTSTYAGDSSVAGRRLVLAEPGDLILWDSRTVHGGVVGTGRPSAEVHGGGRVDLARLSLTVCMTPACKAEPSVLGARRRGFERGSTFTHWPHEARVARSGRGNVTPPELTPQQLSLVAPGGPPEEAVRQAVAGPGAGGNPGH